MTTYAIGRPGQQAYWHSGTAAPGEDQIPADAVAVLYSEEDLSTPPRVRIAADAASVEPILPTLDELRQARWRDAVVWRNQRQEAGCASPLGRVDTDVDSQRKINGAATAAMIAQVTGRPFPVIGWTMADNSVVEHDAPALIALGMAVVAYLDACQQAGTSIRTQIDAAADADALAAIDITAGYPA